MTATGSHIDFGFAARGTTPRGRLFSAPEGVYVDFAAQMLEVGGRGMPPPLQCLAGGYTGILQRTPPPSPSVTPPPTQESLCFAGGTFSAYFWIFP